MARSTKYWHERIEEILWNAFYSRTRWGIEKLGFPITPLTTPGITDDTLENEMTRRRIPDKYRAHFIERYRQVQREAIAARVAARLRGDRPYFEPVVTYGDNSAIREFGMYGRKQAGKTQFLRTFLDTNGAGKVVGRIVSEDGSPIEEGANLPPGSYQFEVVLDEVIDDSQ